MDFESLAVGPAPQLPLATYLDRRKALARRLGNGNTLVVATHPPRQYSNDVEHLFRPHSDFWYLTGFDEPRAVLVLHGGSGATDLFVQPRRKEAEIWTGRRLGVERAPATLGVDRAHDFEDLASALPGIVGKTKVHAIADHDPATRRRIQRAAGKRWVAPPKEERPGGPRKPARLPPSQHAQRLLHEMRLIKSPEEMKLLRKACDLGVAAHIAAVPAIRPGAPERHVEAAFAHHARHHGSNGVGYPSICGCGPNAAVLHYVTNRGTLRKGQLFLADMGCEWGWYTSDITRTYPVGGTFLGKQRELYELVLDAQKTAMRKVRPGARLTDVHHAAAQTLSDGLVDAGLLRMDKETAMKKKAYQAYFMHGTSHWLGIDVHDAGSRTEPDGKPRILREGMVLTVEPGLYFNPDFAECPPGTAGIGIRIEDDVAVTAEGRNNMTRGLPTTAGGIEALLARS